MIQEREWKLNGESDGADESRKNAAALLRLTKQVEYLEGSRISSVSIWVMIKS